jgi:hypothetical protein
VPRLTTCQATTFDELVKIILDLAPNLLSPSSLNNGRRVPPPDGAGRVPPMTSISATKRLGHC